MTQTQAVQTFLKRRLAETFHFRGPRDLLGALIVLFVFAVVILWLAYGRSGDDGSATVDCTYDASSATCTRY